jgi:hypothetical protein
MHELFPVKKPGDPLYAREVNLLSGAIRTAGTSREGGNQFGTRGWFNASAADQSHIEYLMKIVANVVEAGDVPYAGRYKGRPRYFDQDALKWTDWEDGTGGENDYEIDARGYARYTASTQWAPVLLYGDLITVRYDEQRGVLVPVTIPWVDRWVLTPADGIPARVGATESSAVCKFVKEELNTAGDTITWSYLKDAEDADVEYNVFNGFPDDIPGEIHAKVSYNSIGQFHITGVPCSEDSPLV